MKYVEDWDFPVVNRDWFLHQALTLADSNNVCQSPCRNVSTHAKGLWGLASYQTEGDWSRQTVPTHAQSTVQRLAIFVSLSSFDSLTWVNFLSCPYSDSISVLLSCSGSTMPQCNATLSTNTSLHSTSLFFFFFWLFSQKRFHFLIMSRSEGRRVSRSVGWPLSVGIMGITTVLTKWLLLDYSEPVTEQWLDQYKLMVNNFEHQTAGWI